jgi:hypothetical protein
VYTHFRAVFVFAAFPAFLERPDSAAVSGSTLAILGTTGIVLALGLAQCHQAAEEEQSSLQHVDGLLG